MPIEKNVKRKGKEHFTYLEALGHLLCGIYLHGLKIKNHLEEKEK